MVPQLIFSQLVLLALVWVFLLLYWLWPSDPAAHGQAIAIAKSTQHRRSREPKPFAGLTHKPQCTACEQTATDPKPPSAAPPEPMSPTNRRPRAIDTARHCCPQNGCRYRGWLGVGNLHANGYPSGGPWRQFQCTACKGYFLETHGTMFHGKGVPGEVIVHVLAGVAEGLGIRATARVFEVDPNTVLRWLVEAAEHLRAFASYFLCDMQIKQVQLDELYAVLRAVKDGELGEDKAIKRLERSPHWVWTAMDPESKWLVAIDVGARTGALAQRVVHHGFP